MSKAAAKNDFKHIFGIAAVNLAARLFRYDPENAKLEPLVDKELQVFAEGDRELIEDVLLRIRKTFDELKMSRAQGKHVAKTISDELMTHKS